MTKKRGQTHQLKQEHYVRRETYGILFGPFVLAFVVFVFNGLGIIGESIAESLNWFVVAGMVSGMLGFGLTCILAFRKLWGLIYIFLGVILIVIIYILKTLGLMF